MRGRGVIWVGLPIETSTKYGHIQMHDMKAETFIEFDADDEDAKDVSSTGLFSTRKKTRGFFQCNLTLAKDVASRGSLDALVALIVLSFGVDQKGKHPSRTSTHGAQSIQERSGMSYGRASAAIKELQVLNAIKTPGAECAEKRARYQLANPDAGWICIDHGFVEGPRAPLKSLLSRDLSAAAGKPRITKQQAQKDILLTFIALHEAQDFGRFGGVDPKVIAGEFQRISEEENIFQIPDVCALEGHPLYCVVSAKEPLRQRLSSSFANRVLGSDCAGTSQANVEDRMGHAVLQLRKLKLIYTIHVIWDMNPIRFAEDAAPVATLFVKGTPLRRLERGLQYAVDATLKRTLTVSGNEQFYPDGKGRWKSFAQDSGQHRYIVANRDAEFVRLVSQIRVRWWAFSKDSIAGIELDRRRLAEQMVLLRTLD